jgi:hypothetical protein
VQLAEMKRWPGKRDGELSGSSSWLASLYETLDKNPQPALKSDTTTQPAPQAVVNDDVPIAPIEVNAVISDELKGKIKLTNAAVLLVREATYKCDSVSGLRPFLFSYGLTLTCNRFRYSYSIEDRGGHWIVTVE